MKINRYTLPPQNLSAFIAIMGKHLKNILQGMNLALQLRPVARDYVMPSRNGFAQDAQALRGDFGVVGNDMRTVLKRDEPSHYRTR